MKAALHLFLASALLGIAPLPAQSDPHKKADSELQQALADLGHRDFAKRNNAALALWKVGRPALPHLQKLAESSDDPETALRASLLALRIELGVTPDTPLGILQFIKAYKTTPPEKLDDLLTKYLNRHKKEPAVIEALIRRESRSGFSPENLPLKRLSNTRYRQINEGEIPTDSRLVWECVLNYLEKAAEDPRDRIERLLAFQNPPPFARDSPPLTAPVPRIPLFIELSDKGASAALGTLRKSFAAGDHRPSTIRRLALFEFLAGDPDKAITFSADRFAKSENPNEAILLVYLHRLKGDLESAAGPAAFVPTSDAALATFADLGDWISFRKTWIEIPHPDLNPFEEAGIQAALAQLANEPVSRIDAIRTLLDLVPTTVSERHQQLENLVLLGESKSALDLVERHLGGDLDFSIFAIYARWKIALLVADGNPDQAIAFAAPLVRKHTWRSSALTSEFAALLTSQKEKLPSWLTFGGEIPTTSIGSYIATLKHAGDLREIGLFHRHENQLSTIARQRRFAEGHFPDAKTGDAAMWWFFLSKKFPGDSPQQRLDRVASRLAAFHVADLPDDALPSPRAAIEDDIAAMFDHLRWLAARCSANKDSRFVFDQWYSKDKQDVFEKWFSMAIALAHPDGILEKFVDDFSASLRMSPELRLEVASYHFRNPSQKAALTLDAIVKKTADPSAAAGAALMETDPKMAAKLLLQAQLLPLDDPNSRTILTEFLCRFAPETEAEKSQKILYALWSPTRDGFAPSYPNKPTTDLETQRQWLQHFTAQTFRPLSAPPLLSP